jgi:hypothetical protein
MLVFQIVIAILIAFSILMTLYIWAVECHDKARLKYLDKKCAEETRRSHEWCAELDRRAAEEYRQAWPDYPWWDDRASWRKDLTNFGG